MRGSGFKRLGEGERSEVEEFVPLALEEESPCRSSSGRRDDGPLGWRLEPALVLPLLPERFVQLPKSSRDDHRAGDDSRRERDDRRKENDAEQDESGKQAAR